jgi:hypothetical protein
MSDVQSWILVIEVGIIALVYLAKLLGIRP